MEGPTDDNLQFSVDDSIATLTLNRPDARNSLSLSLLTSLKNVISECGDRNDVHVVVVAANGPAFCAGHDLKELTAARSEPDGGEGFFQQTMEQCSATMQSIVSCPKPVIAQVHGVATAAGCQLVASCDLAVASTEARFATPGVNIGLFCSTPMVALSRNIGRKRAMKMLLTGEMIDAQTALDWGLISDVSPTETLSETVSSLAKRIAAKAPKTLKIGKEAFYEQADMPLSEAYDYATAVMVHNMMQEDAEEGIDAFLGKRNPRWRPL